MLTCLFCFCVIFLFKAYPWFSFESSNGDFWIGSSFVSKQIFLVTSGCPRNSCPISGTVYNIYARTMNWLVSYHCLSLSMLYNMCIFILCHSFILFKNACLTQRANGKVRHFWSSLRFNTLVFLPMYVCILTRTVYYYICIRFYFFLFVSVLNL